MLSQGGKGKEVMIKKPRRIPTLPLGLNGKLTLEKERMASDSDRSSDEMTSSYSEYEMEEGQLVQFGKSVGESSKSATILDKDKDNGLTKWKNTGKEITEARQTTETEDSHNISVLPNQNSGTQARRIRLKKHGMSTRSSKGGDKKLDKYQAKMKKNTSGKGTNVEWNLDDRITTMIEEGVKRGYDLKGGGKNTVKRPMGFYFGGSTSVPESVGDGWSQEAWARLDRFLVSSEILLWFPQLTQKGLERSLSDHIPIMLGEPKEDWGPCPFRCYNSWLEDKNIINEAVKGWKNYEVRGSKGFLLFSKLKASKQSMKTWLTDKRNSKMTSTDIEGQLEAIDKKAGLVGWTERIRKERWKLMEKLWESLRREEQMWCQKSRIKWLKEGDRNTNFFHCMANGRRKVNFIGGVTFDGEVCSDPISIRRGIYNFFKNHFRKEGWKRPSMRGEAIKKLS
ncbi:hypothetical protein Dsin_006618 [Dipteronia sinensis]|uniref:Uncharacterized protein n=1 Tax=Dipteronia sinensis TaxID=43782 RepID=A0AAE0AYX8_9ROSI|nr:hypothetical protein Dsin_006618 [Dipteronia sinensis]